MVHSNKTVIKTLTQPTFCALYYVCQCLHFYMCVCIGQEDKKMDKVG